MTPTINENLINNQTNIFTPFNGSLNQYYSMPSIKASTSFEILPETRKKCEKIVENLIEISQKIHLDYFKAERKYRQQKFVIQFLFHFLNPFFSILNYSKYFFNYLLI